MTRPKFHKLLFERSHSRRKRKSANARSLAVLRTQHSGKVTHLLAEPVTLKQSSYCGNASYSVASSCMQGWRNLMEDAHCHVLQLEDHEEVAYFAVFDGHGGDEIANYAGQHMQQFIARQLSDAKGLDEQPLNVGVVLQQAFLAIDECMAQDMELLATPAGCTAVVVLIREQQLFCANAGDSRAVASVNGGYALELSEDHKPTQPLELQRITAAGGYVEFARVKGNLAVSRGLGDYVYKLNRALAAEQQIVTAQPDIKQCALDVSWEFILMACDGVWDVLSSQEAIDFCYCRIARGIAPVEICEQLMDHCLAPDMRYSTFGGDNMTVLLVCLLHGQRYEALVKKCAQLSAERESLLGFVASAGQPPNDVVLNEIFENLNFDEQ